MNEIQRVQKWGMVDRFLGRLGLAGHQASILENSTEEMVEAAHSGRDLSLFGLRNRRAKGKKVMKRVEENYLYSTRRFPNLGSNTIGGGAVTAGDYDFFGNGVGDVGSSMGYYSVSNLTYLQTNMDKGGKIPSGRGFALFELAVSFNAQASAANMAQCLDTMHLRFEKQGGQLVIQHGPIKFWPGGIGMTGWAATTATTTTLGGASHGVPSLASVRRFKSPRILNANDTFKYVVQACAATPQSNTTVALSDFIELTIWLFGFHYDRVPE